MSLFASAGMCCAVGCSAFPSHRNDVVYVDTTGSSLLAREENAKGVHLIDSNDLTLAKHSFEKAIQRDPYFASPHNNLGHMAYTRGDMAAAAAAFDAAIQVDMNNPVPHNNLGLALENGGRPEDAVVEYQIAHQLDPENPQYLGNLVRARLKLAPYDESILPELRRLRFLETRPDWKEWIDEQLAIRFNPYLDRGPADPDLSELDDVLEGDMPPQPDLSEFIIEEVSPDDEPLSARLPGAEPNLPTPLALPQPELEEPSSEQPVTPGPADPGSLLHPPQSLPPLTPPSEPQSFAPQPVAPHDLPAWPPTGGNLLPPVGTFDGPTLVIPNLVTPASPLPPQTLPPLAPPIDWYAPGTRGDSTERR